MSVGQAGGGAGSDGSDRHQHPRAENCVACQQSAPPLLGSKGPAGPLAWAVWLLICHPAVLGLASIAGVGRAVQVGWADTNSPLLYWLLELLVEPARLGIGLAVLGAGRIRTGAAVVRRWFERNKRGQARRYVAGAARQARPQEVISPLRARWRSLVLAVIGLALFIVACNSLIGMIAESEAARTVAAVMLGATANQAVLAITLALKNVSVIPITLAWYGGVYRLLAPAPPASAD